MDLSPLNKAIPSWGAPTLEGFDTSQVVEGQRIKGSARQYVRFYNKRVTEVVATEVETNPRTGEVKVKKREPKDKVVEFVQIITPGDKNEVDQPAEDWHRREFWPQYKAFRDGKTAPIGMPIEEANFVSSNVTTELKYLGVHTVEQLADASDYLCNQVPNGWEMREFARAFAKAKMDDKAFAEVNALKAELANAQEMLAKMAEEQKAMRGMILDKNGNAAAPSEIKETQPSIQPVAATISRGPRRPDKQ